jgi:hypothetical protein
MERLKNQICVINQYNILLLVSTRHVQNIIISYAVNVLKSKRNYNA